MGMTEEQRQEQAAKEAAERADEKITLSNDAADRGVQAEHEVVTETKVTETTAVETDPQTSEDEPSEDDLKDQPQVAGSEESGDSGDDTA